MNRTRMLQLCLAVLMPATVIAADSPHAVDRGQPNRDTEHLTDDDGGPRVDEASPPTLIPNPGGTADDARTSRTCTGVPSIAVSRGGRLWVAWFSGTTPGEIIERCPHAYVVVSTSGDGGETWKEVLANGDWLFPTYARRPNNMAAILAHVSRDRGRTFALEGRCEASWDLFPSEPMVVERKDGSLWMLVRTNLGIGESVSKDGGSTWSPLDVPAIRHTPSRFFIGRLQSGNLLLVKHLGIDDDPLSAAAGRQRRELTAFISQDDGNTWCGGLVLDDRVGCSDPDVQQIADGTIYACWDFMRSHEQEVWMTTFREDDVLGASAEAASVVKARRHLVSKGGTPE
jgi:hypothetical protein